MSDFRFDAAGAVIRKSDGALIPADPRNADYQALLATKETPDAYVAPAPTPAQQAAAALAGGLAITSAGTPAVSGTYACDDAQQNIITRLQTYIAKNGVFPGGAASVHLRLANGQAVAIGSVALFQAIGTAVADFVDKVDEAELVALAGGAWAAPASAVTIA